MTKGFPLPNRERAGVRVKRSTLNTIKKGRIMSVTYLDNAATSFPKPARVYERMEKFLREEAANPGRSGHRMSVEAEASVESARALIAKFIGAQDASRIAFALNCTDALNMGMKGILKKGDHVITSVLEHNSVLRPLHSLEEDGVITLTKVKPNKDCVINPEDIGKAFTHKTRLVALTHASNVTGTLQPICEIGKIVRERGALFLVDGAQTIGVFPIDVETDFIDLLAFPGHKSLLGPTGTGGLYVGKRVEEITPWREGGTGMGSENPTHPEDFPFVLEGGTPNTVGIVGLAEGLKFVYDTGIDVIRDHEFKLMKQLREGLKSIKGVKTFGLDSVKQSTATLSFVLEGLDPADVGIILDQSFNLALRSGIHCAPLCHEFLGTFPTGTIRVSPGFFNSEKDIESLLNALRQLTKQE